MTNPFVSEILLLMNPMHGVRRNGYLLEDVEYLARILIPFRSSNEFFTRGARGILKLGIAHQVIHHPDPTFETLHKELADAAWLIDDTLDSTNELDEVLKPIAQQLKEAQPRILSGFASEARRMLKLWDEAKREVML